MSYCKSVKKLFQINVCGGVKLGLNNAKLLQQILLFPDHSFKSIHVAGTNGKGSVTTKIAKGFELAGYRVGLYTSPHISSFRERIRINGEMISEDKVESLLSELFQITEREFISATFFEITTFLAFLYFSLEKVDIAVIETGLGGRLDATNVITPILSVITSISLDHTEILGETIEKIAWEKGGIIKKGIPILIGPNVPFPIIQKMALENQSECLQVACSSSFFEKENRAIAKGALDFFSTPYSLSENVIEAALEARQPCRFECKMLPGPLTIILDVAHNPNGLQSLFIAIEEAYPKQAVRIVVGLSKNKDLAGCLRILAEKGTHLHLVEAENGRGAPTALLNAYLLAMFIEPKNFSCYSTIADGIRTAKEMAIKSNEILVVCGSFFIMSKARQFLGIVEPIDSMDLNEKLHRYDAGDIKK